MGTASTGVHLVLRKIRVVCLLSPWTCRFWWQSLVGTVLRAQTERGGTESSIRTCGEEEKSEDSNKYVAGTAGSVRVWESIGDSSRVRSADLPGSEAKLCPRSFLEICLLER